MTRSFTMKQLPEEERPRERLLRQGPQTLTTAELIALILGSGTRGKSVIQLAQEIVSTFPDLSRARVEELRAFRGLGKAKAVQLKAALSLAARLTHSRSGVRSLLTTSEDVYHLLKEVLIPEEKENLIVVLKDAKGYLIKWERISVGTLTKTLVHPREVFLPAVRHCAASFILAHNHPSGDPSPSKEDYHVTRQLVEIGKLMCLPIQDHLIIASRGYVSLRERGFSF